MPRPHRPHIAFIGKARSGKDTLAAELVAHSGYTRVAFADPLKEMALEIDPIIGGASGIRLSRAIHTQGWEQAKDNYPEVRRILQKCGQTVRRLDPQFWVRHAAGRIASISGPVVVTDCRYPNEADALEMFGFRIVRVVRPSHPAETVSPEELTNRQHESENLLNDYPDHATIFNSGTVADLRELAPFVPMLAS